MPAVKLRLFSLVLFLVPSLARSSGIAGLLALCALLAASPRAGAQALNEAKALNDKATALTLKGRYAEAEPLFKRELGILERTVGPDSPVYSAGLNNLAEVYLGQGRYAEAEPLYRRSLAIREKTLGANSPDTATGLNNLANLLQLQGHYGDAEPLYRRTLAILEKVRGGAHPDVASALNNLAELYNKQGRYAEAEPLYRRALAIRQKALRPDDPDVATSLNNLAGLSTLQGRYGEAEQLYKQSLAILEKAFGPEHPNVATNLNNLASLYDKQARFADGEPLLKRSLAIREKVLGPAHPDVAEGLNSLAGHYADQGRFSEAEALDKRALAIEEKALGPDHASTAVTLYQLADIYRRQDRYADAEPFYKRALAVTEKAFGPNHPQVARILNNMGLQYLLQRKYAEAEPLYQRSLAIREKTLEPNHPDVAESLGNLAQLYASQGRYAEAEPLYWRALKIMEKAYGPEHPAVAIFLNNLGLLYTKQGRHAEAEPFFRRSVMIEEKTLVPDHREVAISLNNLTKLFADEGRYDTAMPFVRRAIDRRIAKPFATFPNLMGAAQQGLIPATQAFDDSFGVLQQASSSAAADAVQKLAQRYAAGTGRLAELVRRDQDLAGEAARLDKSLTTEATKASSLRNPANEDQLRKRIVQIESERKISSATLGREFPGYVALSKPGALSLDETRMLLADDEAVVAFHVAEKASYAWVVTRGSAFWSPLPANSAELTEEVKKLRQMVTPDADKPFDAAPAYRLYQQTFAPVEEWIKDKKRISVFANGALTSIPFGMLVTADPAGKPLGEIDWLIKSHAITVLPSIYSLKTMRTAAATQAAPKSMIGFADPVFSKTAQARARQGQTLAMRSLTSFATGTQIDTQSLREYLMQLPGTRAEVQTIGKVLGADASDIVLGLDATETRVKQSRLDQYRIVYFATHGLVAGELERFSKTRSEPALALTFPDKPSELDDGLLQATEISALKLNADWVVLSACNTAASDVIGAEALSGLARAFLYAGARSLVVSHWPVADDATAKLMTVLFAVAKDEPNLSHAEAMQKAMLWLINSGEQNAAGIPEAHPALWAPFIVVGEPQAGQ
jgi:CHAT domain-containing protein/Tfp pilus assembly protein PilF